MKFMLFDVCVKCQSPLTKEEIDGSDGFCPKCGYDSDSLTCKTEKKKFVSLRPWWRFWQKLEFVPLEEIGEELEPKYFSSVKKWEEKGKKTIPSSSKK